MAFEQDSKESGHNAALRAANPMAEALDTEEPREPREARPGHSLVG
jgi:hypothetical protein